MSIEKSLYAAPMGLETENTEPITVEIENPESVSIGIDGLEIEIEPGKPVKEGIDDFTANLAEFLNPTSLNLLYKYVPNLF